MAWMSKTLTLELLAIIGGAIDAAYNRILQEPSPLEPGAPEPTQEHQDCVPTITKHHNPQPSTPAEPAPAAPAASPTPTQGKTQTPQYDEETLEKMLNEAKKTLRDINLKDGSPQWITQTLFPHFGLQSLNEIKPEQIPALLDMADAYKEGQWKPAA